MTIAARSGGRKSANALRRNASVPTRRRRPGSGTKSASGRSVWPHDCANWKAALTSRVLDRR